MDAGLDGGVFGGQAERVPAHGVQHVKAPHPLVAGHHVADGVVAHVAHVDAPGGVGEHLQHVIFGPGRVLGGIEQMGVLPALLPLGLHPARFVAACHAKLPDKSMVDSLLYQKKFLLVGDFSRACHHRHLPGSRVYALRPRHLISLKFPEILISFQWICGSASSSPERRGGGAKLGNMTL